MQPLVSILIPCYNGGPWIAEAIRSALDQTYAYREVVVVDDGSQDDSLTIIRSFGDRIRFETGPNRGGNAARNRLIQLSKGSWLNFLDADDFLLPPKIDSQITLLLQRPELDIIYAPAIWEDNGNRRTHGVEDEDLYANYFRWTPFCTNSMLLKKAAVQDVGGWKEDQPVCQEHELILRLILAGKEFALFPQAHVVNRAQSNNSVSRRSPLKTVRQKMALSEKLEAHLLSSGEMNQPRNLALAQARFEAARTAYSWDGQYASALMNSARQTVPMSMFRGVNSGYRLAIQLVGFDLAERLAIIRRWLFQKSISKKSL